MIRVHAYLEPQLIWVEFSAPFGPPSISCSPGGSQHWGYLGEFGALKSWAVFHSQVLVPNHRPSWMRITTGTYQKNLLVYLVFLGYQEMGSQYFTWDFFILLHYSYCITCYWVTEVILCCRHILWLMLLGSRIYFMPLGTFCDCYKVKVFLSGWHNIVQWVGHIPYRRITQIWSWHPVWSTEHHHKWFLSAQPLVMLKHYWVWLKTKTNTKHSWKQVIHRIILLLE